jgi:type IV pilus assembly protein PilW
MRTYDTPPGYRQQGFTLAEIMVGLVIGMLATVIIMQVLSVFEAQKRTTTGTADAQTNGSIALYSITRELQMAGFPLISLVSLPPKPDSPYECDPISFGATGFDNIFPVTIVDNVNGSTSDQITIRYGSAQGGGIPTTINGAPNAAAMPVLNSMGCSDGDHALIMNGAICALTTVSAVTDATTIALVDDTSLTAGAAVDKAYLSCLGRWGETVYAVNNGTLERNGTPAMAGIVNLQAQYGISTAANTNTIVKWVNASAADGWAAPTIAERRLIKAIRIAVVARNEKRELEDVTPEVSAWVGSNSSPAPAVDLSADADWKRYRYRVFETIIPLRNVVWAKNSFN